MQKRAVPAAHMSTLTRASRPSSNTMRNDGCSTVTHQYDIPPTIRGGTSSRILQQLIGPAALVDNGRAAGAGRGNVDIGGPAPRPEPPVGPRTRFARVEKSHVRRSVTPS